MLTNTLQNPKFVLNIIKKDAEKDENSNDVLLSGVEFKLEKLVETTAEGKTQWVVDKNYPFDNTNKGSITGTTGTDGKITQNPFKNLEPGTYRLTETKAHPGYNLLAQPIVIKFTQGGTCSIDGQLIPVGDKFKPGTNNTYTLTLTVLNRKTPELPPHGCRRAKPVAADRHAAGGGRAVDIHIPLQQERGPATLTIPRKPSNPQGTGPARPCAPVYGRARP